jgi:hypothetical protein
MLGTEKETCDHIHVSSDCIYVKPVDTDRLRRQEAMKTAGRENPIYGATWPRDRAHGAVGQNRTRSIEWAEKQEKFQPQEMCFFLTSTFTDAGMWNRILEEITSELRVTRSE